MENGILLVKEREEEAVFCPQTVKSVGLKKNKLLQRHSRVERHDEKKKGGYTVSRRPSGVRLPD